MSGFEFGKRPAPFSLRLSFEERVKLERAAGGVPIGAYVKSLLFGANVQLPTVRRRHPVKDEKALAEVLACLGASRLANNLNQLAKAANSGNLYFDRETKAHIAAACRDIRVMRQLLMQGLGFSFPGEEAEKQSTSLSFARAVGYERASASRRADNQGPKP